MRVEIWSDVVGPSWHVGERRLAATHAAFPHRDAPVVTWRGLAT